MSDTEPVWTYRGYQLRSSEFSTAMVHFFRAEISRANVWRTRLDTTTNWAVVTTGAAISFALSESGGLAVVLLLNMLLISMFLSIEARRYRYYELWSSRVRLMETDFFAAMLVPPFRPSPDWAEALAENLLQPHFSVSMLEALGRRLRRNYIWMYLILLIAWFAKLGLQPYPASDWNTFFGRADVGPVPGTVIFLNVILFNLAILLIGVVTAGMHEASGEVLPRYGLTPPNLAKVGTYDEKKPRKWEAWFRHPGQRQLLIALIITDHGEEVGKAVLKEMNRGATAMPGKGMYTGQPRDVLISALTVTEVNLLKSLVLKIDEKAFVIVSPAKEVFGKGFSSLQS